MCCRCLHCCRGKNGWDCAARYPSTGSPPDTSGFPPTELDTPHLQQLAVTAGTYPELAALLEKAIIDNPPAIIRDGGVLKTGYDSELDELLSISENAGQFLIDLEAREKARTGLANLKVGYNRVHGYFIELPSKQAESAPADYIRRQTLKNAERYITPELKEFEDKALSAQSRALAREKALYEELIDIELPLSATETVFPKKTNTLSYAFEKDGLSLGYYKILSAKVSATQGVVVFTLHKQ